MNIVLVSSILFGIIDALFFLFAETTLQDKINQLYFFDRNMAELLTGGISASIAIFFTTLIRNISNVKMSSNPFVDVLGIMIGTFVVIFFYHLFKIKK